MHDYSSSKQIEQLAIVNMPNERHYLHYRIYRYLSIER